MPEERCETVEVFAVVPTMNPPYTAIGKQRPY